MERRGGRRYHRHPGSVPVVEDEPRRLGCLVSLFRAGPDAVAWSWEQSVEAARRLMERGPWALMVPLAGAVLTVALLLIALFVVAWTVLMFSLIAAFWWLLLLIWIWEPRDAD